MLKPFITVIFTADVPVKRVGRWSDHDRWCHIRSDCTAPEARALASAELARKE